MVKHEFLQHDWLLADARYKHKCWVWIAHESAYDFIRLLYSHCLSPWSSLVGQALFLKYLSKMKDWRVRGQGH